MKNILLHFFLLLFFSSSYAQTKEELTSAINDLSKKIIYKEPLSFDNNIYAELAYLRRNYNLPLLTLNDSLYKRNLIDYYYKRFYLYSKFLNEDAVVTEDCINDEANAVINRANKLLFYVIYPNSIKLPANIVDQFEEYATVDEFYGPYVILEDIYFLKKYNYDKLTKMQKEKLAGLEGYLSKLVYSKYVENKPWSFHRLNSLKVLKMNNNALVADVKVEDIVKYFNDNGELDIPEADKKDIELMKTVGYRKVLQYDFTAVLWIFLLELKKK